MRPAASAEEVFGPYQDLLSRRYTDSDDPLCQDRLQELFGSQATLELPLSDTGIGCRVRGINLTSLLSQEQAAFVIDLLSGSASNFEARVRTGTS